MQGGAAAGGGERGEEDLPGEGQSAARAALGAPARPPAEAAAGQGAGGRGGESEPGQEIVERYEAEQFVERFSKRLPRHRSPIVADRRSIVEQIDLVRELRVIPEKPQGIVPPEGATLPGAGEIGGETGDDQYRISPPFLDRQDR